MMELKDLIEKMTPEIYKNLKRAIEIGKWPDGRVLTREQKESTLQAIIAYEFQANVPESEKVGFVNTQGSDCHADDGSVKADNLEQPKPMKWKH